MTQSDLNQAVARATGEHPDTIERLGFGPLIHRPVEEHRKPLIIDWDELYSSGPDRHFRRPCRARSTP